METVILARERKQWVQKKLALATTSILFVAACSSHSVRRYTPPKVSKAETTATSPQPIEATAATPAEAAETVAPAKPDPTAPAPTATANQQAAAPAPPASILPSESAKPKASLPALIKNVSGEQALLWLQHGNQRFVSGHLRRDGQSQRDLKRTSIEQHPHAIVVSCNDSRVPPELIFDQKIGEIYVVRTAAETLDTNTTASIEYAVKKFGARLIYVIGHTQCDVLKTAKEFNGGLTTTSDLLDSLLEELKSVMLDHPVRSTADLSAEAADQAARTAVYLSTKSSLIKEYVQTGEVTVKAGLYHTDTGKLETF